MKKPQEIMSIDDDHQLLYYWSGTRKALFEKLQEFLPFVVVGFYSEKNLTITCTPMLVILEHDPRSDTVRIPYLKAERKEKNPSWVSKAKTF